MIRIGIPVFAAVLLLASAGARGAADAPFDPALVPEHGAASVQVARSWTQAFVTGNGQMGGMVMGAEPSSDPPRPEEETIYFSDSRLYLPLGTKATVPNIAGNLAQLRQTIRTRGYGPAAMSAFAAAQNQNFPGMMCTDPFMPAFELRIRMTGASGGVSDSQDGTSPSPDSESKPRAEPATGFLRTENFQTGEASVYWSERAGSFVRKLFISRADHAAVLWIGPASTNPDRIAPVSCDIWVPPIPSVPVRAFLQNHPDAAPVDAAANALIDCKNSVDPAGTGMTLHALYREGGGTGYDVGIRIIADGGSAKGAEGKISIREARSVLVLTRIEPFKRAVAGSSRQVLEALGESPFTYQTLLARHTKLHRELFDRASLDLHGGPDRRLTTDELLARANDGKLSPAIIEKLYEGSRYALICASGDRPPNVFGIWSGSWAPPAMFPGDFALDSGLHLSIGSALSSRTPELLHGLFALADESVADWQLNAKNLFGARGILVPPHQSSAGRNLQWSDHAPAGLWWTSGAGMLAHWYYDYYLYTGDRQFLATRAFPFMKQAAAFYEDFLVMEPSGRYRFCPSCSIDDAPGDNSTQEIMVARELLTNLVAAARELRIEQGPNGGITKWQAMLDAMPPYLIAPNGELQEWALPGVMNKTGQRHIPHLYAIYQSGEFDPETTPDFWNASHAAFETRLNQWFRPPTRPGEMNPQPVRDRLQMGLCAARFGEGQTVWDILSRLIMKNTYPSMLTQRYEDGKTLSLEGNGAIPEILHAALLYSRPGRIDLLPALPPALPSGEIRGLAARGEIVIDRLTWSPGAVEVELTSAKDQTLEIRAPKGSAVRAAMRTVALKANHMEALKFAIP